MQTHGILFVFPQNEEGTGLAGAGAGAQDQGRIGEMVNHLQETCESKDEVLVRLFDLICLREVCMKMPG